MVILYYESSSPRTCKPPQRGEDRTSSWKHEDKIGTSPSG